MSTCPSHDDFKDYVLGILSTDRAEVIEAHLDTCESCQTTLDEVASESDELVHAMRHSQADATIELDSGWRQAEALVKAIGQEWSQVAQPAPTTTMPIRQLREYELLEELGHGGMGTVYKALHTKLQKVVALKVLPNDRMENADAVRRFEREMQAVGRLDHPHIVRATDAGEVDGTHFLVMEYVEGLDLSKLVTRFGPLPVPEACEIVRQAALGLQHAYEHGMVHRDIKPSNLMLSSGHRTKATIQDAEATVPSAQPQTVKILDLGLALLHDAPATGGELTSTNQIMGTLDYMAPEQAADTHAVDIRADLYSLGATLYKLLSGKAPCALQASRSPAARLNAVLNSVPVPIGERRPELPEALAELIGRLLEKDPAARPTTPAELVKALLPFTVGADLTRLIEQPSNQTVETAPVPTATASSINVSSRLIETDVVADRKNTSSTPQFAEAESSPKPTRSGKWGWSITAAALFLAVLAGIIIQVKTRDGVLLITVPQSAAEDVTVEVDGERVEISNRDGDVVTVEVAPGPHHKLLVTVGEIRLLTDSDSGFEIDAGAELPIVARFIPEEPRPPGSELDSFPAIYALSFDGDDVVTVQSLVNDGETPLTIEAWARPTPPPTQVGFVIDAAAGMSLSGHINGKRTWLPFIRNEFREQPLQWHRPQSVPEEDVVGEWVHLAVCYGENTIQFFIDGELAAEMPGGLMPFQSAEFRRTFRIGAGRGIAPDTYFFGTIDEVRISSTARYTEDFTPQERFEADEDTLALYHFDEGEGDVLIDSSGNDHHGTIHGATWVRADAPLPSLESLDPPAFTWDPGPPEDALPGIIPRPAEIPGLHRWQMETVMPRTNVDSVAWSHDGAFIACGTEAGQVRLYAAEDLSLVRVLSGHTETVETLDWSPDGTRLASGSRDGTVRLWNPDDGTSAVLEPSLMYVLSVAWSPDGEWVAAGGAGHTHLWTPDGILQRVLVTGRANALAWRPDSELLGVGGTEITLWQLDGTSGALLPGHDGDCLSLAWSLDGEWLASGGSDASVRLWKQDWTPGPVLEGHQGSVRALAWNRDGWLASSSVDTRIWEPGGAPGPVIKGAANSFALAWSPGGDRVVTGGERGISVHRADGDLEIQRQPSYHDQVHSVAWRPDGGTLASMSSEVWFWEPDGQAAAKAEGVGRGRMAWNPTGDLLASTSGARQIQVWNSDGFNFRELTRFPAAGGAIAWKPDGNWIAAALGDGTVRLVHRDGTPGPVLDADLGLFNDVAWSPDGWWLASCSNRGGDDAIKLWNPDGTHAATLFDAGDSLHGVTALAWDQQGNWLATGGGPESWARLHLWNMDGEPIEAYPPMHNNIVSIDWSPDGHRLIAASYDHTLQLCELDGTSQLLTDHDGPVVSALWAREGNRIASGSHDQTLIVWDADTAEPEWIGVMLYGDEQAAAFTAAGKPLFLTADAADELVYVVEREPGRQELWSYREFQEYLGTGRFPRRGYDQDHALAEWVFAHSGRISVRVDGDPEWTNRVLESAAQLPDGPFRVEMVVLRGCESITDADVETLRALCPSDALYHLNLSGTSVTDQAVTGLAGMRIVQLELSDTAVTDAVVDDLAAIEGLGSLFLNTPGITDAACAEIARLEGLTYLTLAGTEITDAGARQLSNLTNLNWLDLSRTAIGDATLEALQSLDSLRALQISKTNVTDDGLALLEPLNQLHRVELSYNMQITDVGLEALSRLPHVDFLYVGGTSVTDAGLVHLGRLTELKTLSLADTVISDAGVEHLKQIATLELLDLTRISVTAGGVAQLQEALPNCRIVHESIVDIDRQLAEWVLERGGWVILTNSEGPSVRTLDGLPVEPIYVWKIYLNRTGIGDAELAELAGLLAAKPIPARELLLGETRCTDAGLVHLAGLSLTGLNLDSTRVTNAAVAHLRGINGLRNLLCSRTQIDDDGLATIAELRDLTILQLFGTQISGEGLVHLRQLPDLKHLGLGGDEIDDADLVALRGMPQLSELMLLGTRITDAGLETLGELTNLRTLDLRGAEVTAAGLARLQEVLPNCRIVHESIPGSIDPDRAVAEWVFDHGGVVRLWRDGGLTGQVSSVADLPDSHELNINTIDFRTASIPVSDEDIRELTQLVAGSAAGEQVKRLFLDGMSASNIAIELLQRLPQLTEIGMSRTGVTDEFVLALSGHTNLSQLGLANTEISDACLAMLADLPRLKSLDLIGTGISDEGLRWFHAHETLEGLQLAYTEIGDAGIGHLSDIRGIRLLNLTDTNVSDDGLAVLSTMPSLEKLLLSYSKITDAGLERLASLSELQSLNILKTDVTAEGVARLHEALPNCRIIHESIDPDRAVAEWVIERGGFVAIQPPAETGPYLRKIEEIPETPFQILACNLFEAPPEREMPIRDLEELWSLAWSHSDVDDATILQLSNLPSLTTVSLHYSLVGDAALEHLSQFTELETLTVTSPNVTDAGLEHLLQMPSLRELDVECPQITNTGLESIGGIDQLESLEIGNMPQVTDEGLAHLVNLPRLIALRIESYMDITWDGIGQLSALPALESLTVQGTRPGDLNALARFDRLTTLGLRRMEFETPDELRLPSLPNLQRLDLNLSQINDAFIAIVAEEYPDLEFLGLKGTPVTDGCVAALSGLERLQELALTDTQITAGGFSRLQELLPDCRIDYESIDPDRAVAEWVFDHGGQVMLSDADEFGWRSELLSTLTELPTDRDYQIRAVMLNDVQRLADDDVAELATLIRGVPLHSLQLAGTSASNAAIAHLADTEVANLGLSRTPVTDEGVAVLSEIRSLIQVQLTDTGITDAGVQNLSQIKGLQFLLLGGTAITDACLPNVARLKELQWLDLIGTAVSDEGVRFLEANEKLQILMLRSTQITDEGLLHLKDLPELRSLELSHTSIGDAGMAHIAAMPALEVLSLSATSVTDVGLSQLHQLSRLTELRLTRTNVTADGVARLREALPDCRILHESIAATMDAHRAVAEFVFDHGGQVSLIDADDPGWQSARLSTVTELPDARNYNIHSIRLDGVEQIGDDDVAELAALIREVPVHTFSLNDTSISDASIAHLAQTEIAQLSLSRTLVSDEGLPGLVQIRTLKNVGLDITRITDAGVRTLSELSALQGLTLRGTDITDTCLPDIARLSNLTWLDLGQTAISDAGLRFLQANMKLNGLLLYQTQITDDGLSHLSNLPELRVLDLHGTGISDDGVALIAEMDGLESLVLSYTSVTDAGLSQLHQMNSLTELGLTRTDVTEDGIARLREALPDCRIFHESIVATLDAHRAVAEWVFAHGGTVALIGADDPGWQTGPLSTVAELPVDRDWRIHGIHLNRTQELRDADVAELAALLQGVRVYYFALGDNRLTDAAIAHLAGIEIVKLVLSQTSVTDEGLGGLAEIRSLNHVAMDGTPITDAGVHVLCQLEELRILMLGNTDITDACLPDIAELTDLDWLSLNNTAVSDEGLQFLAGHENLSVLQLTGAQITDEGLSHLSNLPELRSLDVNGTGISDDGMALLGEMRRLESLRLIETRITDAGLEHLGQLSRLSELNVMWTDVTADGVARLQDVLPDCEIIWEGDTE